MDVMGTITETRGSTDSEPSADLSDRLNWLRAGVLGANDGIVSVAATVVGVAAAVDDITPILLAGAAALVGGAISMALGEFVSVSSAADSQRGIIARVSSMLRTERHLTHDQLTETYRAQGLSRPTAELVASELSDDDRARVLLSQRYHLAENEVLNPLHAAIASALAFLAGAILPFLTIVLVPLPWRIPVTMISVLIALSLTGGLGAKLGGAPVRPAVRRVALGGIVALAVTYGIGALLGVAIG